jgi:hypothetical protein
VGNKDLQAAGAAGAGVGAEIIPQSYNGAVGSVPGYISGVSAPEYGMTYTGTPIGLPGPPHLPLGHGAGLCFHGMHNHTHMRMPPRDTHFNVHVKQEPSMSYPQPVTSVHINERAYPDPLCPECPPGGHVHH